MTTQPGETGVYTGIVRGRVEHWDEWDEGTGAEQRGGTVGVQRINIWKQSILGGIF